LNPHNLAAQERMGRDAYIDSGTALNEIIDRLAKVDLGPSGFFVICHASSRGE
jgi:hypothetical protein